MELKLGRWRILIEREPCRKYFNTLYGRFWVGQPVMYSVYPHGEDILGLAYPHSIESVDRDFVDYCREQGIATYCEWNAAHDVKPYK